MSPRTLACVLLLLGGAAGAQEVPDDLAALLDSDVVSGASRAAERADDAPATITRPTPIAPCRTPTSAGRR